LIVLIVHAHSSAEVLINPHQADQREGWTLKTSFDIFDTGAVSTR
jgi:hypothetical protein